jgi:hypothetical protein
MAPVVAGEAEVLYGGRPGIVVLYVVFVATAGRPYYLAGLYAPLAAAGALGCSGVENRRRPPTMTPCSTSDAIPAHSVPISPTRAPSVTSARTCMRIC